MPLTHTSALLTIATPNFDRLVNFYQQLLEQTPVTLMPNIYAEFHLPGVKLGIFRPKEKQEGKGARYEVRGARDKSATQTLTPGISHPTLHTPHSTPIPDFAPSPQSFALCLEVENLETAIAHLDQLGSPPGEIMSASHGREIYAYDPDGNWLIVHQSHVKA